MVKTKAKGEKKSASKNEFVAGLKNDKEKMKRLQEAAQSERKGGDFSSDEEVIEIYGLEEGVKAQVKAKLAGVSFGKDKNKNRYFTFQFVDVSDDDDTSGTQFSQFFGLAPAKSAKTAKKKEESEAKAYARMFQFFQAFGYDTKKWKKDPLGDACDAAQELTKEHPICTLSLYTWGDDDERLGINVKKVHDSEDEDADDDDDDEEEEDEDEEEDTKSSKKKGTKSKKKSKKDDDDDDEEEEEEDEEDDDDDEDSDDDDDEEEDEDEDDKPARGKAKGKGKSKSKDTKSKSKSKKSKDEDEEEDDDEEEEEDYSTWIDYEGWYKPKGKKKEIIVTLNKWNAKKKLFTGHSEILDQDFQIKPEELRFDEDE